VIIKIIKIENNRKEIESIIRKSAFFHYLLHPNHLNTDQDDDQNQDLKNQNQINIANI